MRQLRLEVDLERGGSDPAVAMAKDARRELVTRMAEALVVVHKARERRTDEPSKEQSQAHA